MPVQRVSKPFKDISATFQTNPLNSDLIALNNSNAISRSIRNLILTVPGDKPFQPDLGSEVYDSLFDQLDQITAASIQSQIENTIIRYEPRVSLTSVDVKSNIPNNAFDVLITYEVIGVELPTQQINFALELTR
jgi:phage baseplate assembly protein W|tara:strand:- start:1438 stop:1839 length:402 start_codon:yes stop_codon:yes gene_type:complete